MNVYESMLLLPHIVWPQFAVFIIANEKNINWNYLLDIKVDVYVGVVRTGIKFETNEPRKNRSDIKSLILVAI